jgi:hypothetical protein
MPEGSTSGAGLFLLAIAAPTKFCHCGGSPTNFPSFWSKPVWTRCWKFVGAEMTAFFFFFDENMAVFTCPTIHTPLASHKNTRV